MSGFDYLIILFFLCWMVLIPCEGKMTLPPGGKIFIFKPGSTEKIQWSFDDSISDVESRRWTFASNGSGPDRIAAIKNDEDPTISKQWLSRAAVDKPSTLILRNIDRHFNGTYTFLVYLTNDLHKSEVTVFIAEKPTVTINCSSTVTVDEGDDVVCTCIGEGGNPPGDVYVSWYYNDHQIGETRKERRILILRNVKRTSNGTYTCKAQSHNLTDNKSIEVRVRPDIKPTITSFTTDPLKAVVGQPVTIICVAIARPEPSYTIIHNGTRIVSTDNTYTISRAEWNDTGTYTCNATNALGNDLEFLNLTVGQLSTTFSTTKARDRTVGTHTNGHKKKRGLGVFAIVGIVVGVLALVVIIIGVIYWFIRCKEKNHEEEGNADAPLKKRRADANVYDAVATGGDDGEASTSTAPHEYATLEQVRSPHCADTQDL